jgi:hypothetical protein
VGKIGAVASMMRGTNSTKDITLQPPSPTQQPSPDTSNEQESVLALQQSPCLVNPTAKIVLNKKERL